MYVHFLNIFSTFRWHTQLNSLLVEETLIPKVYTMAADDNVTQGTRASVAIVLTKFSQDIPISAPEGLAIFLMNKIHTIPAWHDINLYIR